MNSKPLFIHLDLFAEIWFCTWRWAIEVGMELQNILKNISWLPLLGECGWKDNRTSWDTVALYAQGVTCGGKS